MEIKVFRLSDLAKVLVTVVIQTLVVLKVLDSILRLLLDPPIIVEGTLEVVKGRELFFVNV